jgi:hypothetical protein
LGRKKKEKSKKLKEYQREFLPPVELKTDPDYPVKFPSLVVAGHRVTPREADIFYTFHTMHSTDLTCEKFGITRQTLWDMRKREWWLRWELDQLKEWMDTTRNHYLSTGSKIIKALNDVLDEPTKAPSGHAMAVTKMMQIFLQASPEGLRPTLVSKFEFEHQAEIKETVDVNITITSDKIKKLSPEQIDEWNRTGVMPQQLTEIMNQTINADFEEIKEEEEYEEGQKE